MRILSKLILARERQPLAQSTWAVRRRTSPRKRPHLKLPIGQRWRFVSGDSDLYDPQK